MFGYEKELYKQKKEKKQFQQQKNMMLQALDNKTSELFESLKQILTEEEKPDFAKIKQSVLSSSAKALKIKNKIILAKIKNPDKIYELDIADTLLNQTLMCDEAITRILKNLSALQETNTPEKQDKLENVLDESLEDTTLSNKEKEAVLQFIYKASSF